MTRVTEFPLKKNIIKIGNETPAAPGIFFMHRLQIILYILYHFKMRISGKPTIYIIDGLNFVRSFLMGHYDEEDAVTKDFLSWIENASSHEMFDGSVFRVIFDGGYRNIGPTLRGGVKITFSESLTADEVISESAVYLHESGQRVCVVTSDRSLQQDLRVSGVKTVFCEKFFNSVNTQTRSPK